MYARGVREMREAGKRPVTGRRPESSHSVPADNAQGQSKLVFALANADAHAQIPGICTVGGMVWHRLQLGSMARARRGCEQCGDPHVRHLHSVALPGAARRGPQFPTCGSAACPPDDLYAGRVSGAPGRRHGVARRSFIFLLLVAFRSGEPADWTGHRSARPGQRHRALLTGTQRLHPHHSYL